ncbi:hypothetical protein T552_00508 [Pneumocystis carinii B80]|uniref:Protein kinase domain-containing protein n=1 Tax=Pneumocystis carinii (strain B80) TaxID=1408658 RepID=A0A0W4ZQZ8_PNEC8|nr:hypothetical protein T552_00508 [Pneumocystis carinii B80]KTW30796.1 hypothetical protein T552_00508 [Pneumocystis carinii B80]
MNKNVSEPYSFYLGTNEEFLTKNYNKNERESVEIMNDKKKEVNLRNYRGSPVKQNSYLNVERNRIDKSRSFNKEIEKSVIFPRELCINNEQYTPYYNVTSEQSSAQIKTSSMLNNRRSLHLYHTSGVCMDWKQPFCSFDQSNIEKSSFSYNSSSFDSYASKILPLNMQNSYSIDNSLDLKSLRSFSDSITVSNNFELQKKSLEKSIKSKNISEFEPLSKKNSFSNLLSDFYSIKLKSNLSKEKKHFLFRKMDPQGKPISLLHASTIYLTEIFKMCNPEFNYEPYNNPKRVLTKPSKGIKNDGYDNEDNDYILYVNDILGSDKGHRYLILDILGQGTFGQVVKCKNMQTQEIVAVKVIKNKPAYFNQSIMEITILDLLNKKVDKSRKHNILQLKDTFIHKKHLCIVSELLSLNLYELIKQNQFKGLSTNLVRIFAIQILDAMIVLNEAKIIHCDLKPENILLNNLETPVIKIIDFGSACHERQTIYTYIQSRFYRSPEVLLGLPYSSSIDIWSFGCIVAELFLGLPLFPGTSEYNQIFRIVEMLGMPPIWMIEMGKQSSDFFDKIVDDTGLKIYCLKTMEQYAKERNTIEVPNKKYFSASTLPEIVKTYPMQKKFSKSDIDNELALRIILIDFLTGLLNINPLERWSPQQAKMHPFILGNDFSKNYTPSSSFNLKSPTKSPTKSSKNILNTNHLNTNHSDFLLHFPEYPQNTNNNRNSKTYSIHASGSYTN